MADVRGGGIYFEVFSRKEDLARTKKELEAYAKSLETALSVKLENPFEPLADGAKKAKAPLTDLERQIKSYGNQINQTTGLQRTQALTTDQAVAKLKSLTGEITRQMGALDSAGDEYGQLAVLLKQAATETTKLEAAQVRSQKAFDANRVREYRDAQNLLRTELERGAIDTATFTTRTQALQTEMVEARGTFKAASAELGSLDRVIGTTARGMQTAEGHVSKLGLSQQVAIGNTRKLGDQFGQLQGSLLPLIGVAGLGGLIKLTGDFVGESERAKSAAALFDKAIARSGQNAGDADVLVKQLADTFGLLPSTVEQAALPILRAGGTLEDVSNALFGAGASAAAGGRDIANAFTNIGQAVATGRSELTESADIMVNSSDAYKDYADSIGVSVDALTEQQKVQAYANAIAEETRYELEDLDAVLTDQVKSQQNFRTAMAEARQELGQKFAPVLTAGTDAATGLLSTFDKLPDTAQSSVVGIGGITTGVAVLATGMNGLRLAMLPLFAPPAGLIIGGVAAAAALGTAIFTAAQKHETAADKVDRLTTSAANLKVPLDDLKSATSKQQLLGNIETLAAAMDGDAKVAFTNYATAAVESARTTGDAVLGIMQGVAVARQTILQGAVDAQEELLADLKRNVQESQTQFNIATATGGSGSDSSALDDLRAQLAEAKAEYAETQAEMTRAAQAGNQERAAALKADLADIQSYITETVGLIGEELENTPAGRLNVDTSAYQAAQRDLNGLREQLDELNRVIETGSIEEIEALFNQGAESADNLTGALTETGTAGDNAAGGVAAAGTALSNQTDIVNRATTANRSLAETSLEVLAAQKQYQDSLLASGGNDITAGITAAVDAFGPYRDLLTEMILGNRDLGEATALTEGQLSDQAAAAEGAAKAQGIWRDSVNGVVRPLLQTGDIVADVAPAIGILGTGYISAAEGAGFFAETVGSVPVPLAKANAETTDYLGTLGGLPDAYEEAIASARLLGDGQSDAAIKAEVARTELERLIDSGLKPTDKAVQVVAAEYDKWTQASKRAETAQQNVSSAVGDAKSAITEVKDALGKVDLSKLTEGGPEALQAYLDKLRELATLLQTLKTTNPKVFQNMGGNEALQSINALIPRVEKLTEAEEDAAKAAERMAVLKDVVSSVLDVVGQLAGELSGTSESLGIFAESATNALTSLISGDFVGFFSSILEGIVGMFTYYAKEMEQYSAVAIQYGEDIAYQFVELDATGREVFDEEAFEGYLQGLERISERVEALNEELAFLDDSINSVQDAEVGAREDALATKLDSQGGNYTFADILEEQTLAIGRAAQDRDAAYEEAAALDAAGQHELADRMRAAADSSYNSAVTTINQNAANQAAEIGAATQTNLDAIAANSGASGEAWTQYWNDDSNAQLAAKKNAQIQERRFMQVLNSERYAELLKAGYTEEEAWRIASAELGYTIDETSGDLIASTDAAAQQQSASITAGTTTTTAAITAATSLIGSAFFNQGATLGSAAVGSGVLLDNGLRSLFGGANTTLFGQGGALTSTIGSVFGSVAGALLTGSQNAANATISGANLFSSAIADSANLANTTLFAGGSANIGTITGVNIAVGKTIIGGGNAVRKAAVDAGNTVIKQNQEAARKQAEAEVKLGQSVNDTVARVSTAKTRQVAEAARVQASGIASAYNAVIGTIKLGNVGQANAFTGVYTNVAAIIPGVIKQLQTGSIKIGTSGSFDVGAIKNVANSIFQNPEKYNITKPGAIDGKELAKKFAEDPSKYPGLSGSKGSGGGNGGSGSSGSKGGSGSGSGGKKDGSSYSGGKSEDYPEGSPGWYQAKMSEIDEQIKKTSSASKIKELQAKKKDLQAKLDALLGTGDGDKTGPAGSISALEAKLQQLNEAFEQATTTQARESIGKQITETKTLLEQARAELDNILVGEILGEGNPDLAKNSTAWLKGELEKAQRAAELAATEEQRRAAGLRILLLEEEIAKRTKLLGDAAKEENAVSVNIGNSVTVDKDIFATYITAFIRDGVEPFGEAVAALTGANLSRSLPRTLPGTASARLDDALLRSADVTRPALPQSAAPDLSASGAIFMEAAMINLTAAQKMEAVADRFDQAAVPSLRYTDRREFGVYKSK